MTSNCNIYNAKKADTSIASNVNLRSEWEYFMWIDFVLMFRFSSFSAIKSESDVIHISNKEQKPSNWSHVVITEPHALSHFYGNFNKQTTNWQRNTKCIDTKAEQKKEIKTKHTHSLALFIIIILTGDHFYML